MSDFELERELSLDKKIERAIQLLRDNEPKDELGYGLAFSGGKDSIVIKKLAEMSGVKFGAFYSQTTIDRPQLIQYLREKHPDVKWIYAKIGFFGLMIKKGMPPNFRQRWCCAELKEKSLNEFQAKIIGVRAAESPRCAKRWKEITPDFKSKNRIYCCPIVHWSDDDVWNFIRREKLPYCELYDKGYKRLGCIACPLTSVKNIKRELAENPQFDKAMQKAFDIMWEKWHDKIMPAKGMFPEHKHFSSRFKNGHEWYLHHINRGFDAEEETCQMELMYAGGNQEEGNEK